MFCPAQQPATARRAAYPFTACGIAYDLDTVPPGGVLLTLFALGCALASLTRRHPRKRATRHSSSW